MVLYWDEQENIDIARQPYERGDFSVKVSFAREKSPRGAPSPVAPAWNPRIFVLTLSVDQWTGIFYGRPRETASDCAIWSPVDSGGQVDKL